jgi:hypothetical protein
MSNTLAPFGFRYIGRDDGAQPNYAISYKQIYYTDSNKIAFGDPVKTVSATGANQGYMTLGTTNTQVLGIFIGCYYTDSNLGYVENKYWNAPTTALINTCQGKFIGDRDAQFEVQIGNLTTAITQTSIGLNAAFGGAGTPTTTSGISTAYIDGATIQTTNTLPFRIQAFSQGYFNGAANDPTSANPIVNVILNSADINSLTGV